jgi:MFS superfamily sulfate permease-like transporter
MSKTKSLLTDLVRNDLPAGLVVFLVALPLCLGIALASGAPLVSGVVAGVVGGVIVGYLSGSHVSVSGPAAGLTVIILDAITKLGGNFSQFLSAVVLAGLFQIILGSIGLGIIANYVPIAVIEGMLTAIGIVIILKQIPHALGHHSDFEGDFSFTHGENYTNTIQDIFLSFTSVTPGACIVTVISLLVLLKWDDFSRKIHRLATFIPSSLVAVCLGVIVNQLFIFIAPSLYLPDDSPFRVQLPTLTSEQKIWDILPHPDFNALLSTQIWSIALTIAVVATLESLLSLEAADKLDPQRRISPPNREVVAQGFGNLFSGLLGGLPVTSVVVRTSANIYAGARTKWSSITHGLLLLISLICIPKLLNYIPLSSLAAILLVIGFKLCKLEKFRAMYSLGWMQWIPFITTIIAIIFTDLLTGVLIGLAVGIFFVLRSNHHSAFTMVSQESLYLIRFNKDVSFLNKSELKEMLLSVPSSSTLYVDGIKATTIDHDIRDLLIDYKRSAKYKRIHVEFKNIAFS